ncbi:MFS transporter [Burkholderia sp. WAC0059]|uniref:MFS transporter n=1 Tax=Burkholderia sp. WAC0059 TaxID=2066022 RepID=UPI000C7ED981|nr:MFS transporter [Burkholderia sp. WAC0059]PLZ03170.1 MFS transporter [Burkholderia sp. WAC0059]
MGHPEVSLDDAPVTWFHRRLAFLAAGGPFCDGYILGIVVVALPLITKDLHLTALQNALFGAAGLLGMFLGGAIFGPITDRFGRRPMYILNLVVFVVLSLAHLVIHDLTLLIVVRVVMGMAIGADYPIATALVVEFLPRKLRGPTLSSLTLMFWLGYIVSMCVGPFVADARSEAWRYVLASAAIPSAIFLFMRLDIPESPRWLLSAGRVDEARRIVLKHLGPHVDFAQLQGETPDSSGRKGLGFSSIRDLFRAGYGPTLFFCSMFWLCQVAPSFAIKTFQPLLLQAIGVRQVFWGTLAITSFAIIGTALGMAFVNRVGRRWLLIGSYVGSTAALLILATPLAGVAALAVAMFILFTVSEAVGSSLQFVYPNELFPTHVRATGMGLAIAASRIGAAAGTFALPLTLSSFGETGGMLTATGISAVGLLVSLVMAPETRERGLAGTQALTGQTETASYRDSKV